MFFAISLVSAFGIAIWQLHRITLGNKSYDHLQVEYMSSENSQEYDFEEAMNAIHTSDEQLRDAVEELLRYRSYSLL